MAILSFLIGILFVCALEALLRRKKQTPADRQGPAPGVSAPAINPSYLEEKIWYETELDFLFRFNEKLVSALGVKEAVRCITEAAHNFLSIERTVFLSWNNDSQKFILSCALGWEHERTGEVLSIGMESISGLLARNREPLLVADLSSESYLVKLKKEEFLQKAFIGVPVIYKDEFLGVLYVCDKKSPGPFTQREASVVMHIARVGAVTLQNVRLYEQALKRAEELRIAYEELKEMQDKLTQMEKLKAIGQLASGVAHDMRNPLGIIMQGVSYLEQVIPPSQKDQLETLFMVKDSVQRADGIVASLLDFSRAAKLELQPEDIGKVLESCLNLVKTELKHVTIIREIREGLPKVMIDKNRMMQVFINLLMNASYAMSGKGSLFVRCFPGKIDKEEAVVTEIEDTGSGISEENLKRIFDPFFTTKGPGKGTGLGLSISRNIVDLHKGLIEIKSQVGKGTKIIITLRAVK